MAGKSAPKRRLDRLVVERGLAPTREQAQALILAGAIRVGGAPAAKPGHLIPADAAIVLAAAPPPYASRAGAKLAAALDAFAIPVAGRVALDVGSSTGGFTDCLLQRGARRVHAVDAGTNQMVWRLRTDPRVHLLENTNARYLRASDLGEAPVLLTVDVAFISVTLLLPALAPLLAPGADAVILVKPQFECGREAVGKGGIVRDPAARQAAVERVAAAVRVAGGEPRGALPSPVLGARGNQEWLLAARFPA